MTTPAVVYDACVLYPAPLRSLLMYLALSGEFRARWSDDIHEEWMRSAVRDYPNFSRQQAETIRGLMDAHVLDCLVTDYRALIPSLNLPDDNDRHVLAAAIRSKATVIVTFNLADFPTTALQPHGIEAQHPDAFVLRQIESSTAKVCLACRQHRASLKKPPLSVEEYLAVLERQGVGRSVAALRQFTALL